jgi:hypothetical protein
MVSEVSAHGLPALLLWACGEAEHQGKGCAVEDEAHLMVDMKQRERGGKDKCHPSKAPK